jgi:ketosteroid isomerase-like protein
MMLLTSPFFPAAGGAGVSSDNVDVIKAIYTAFAKGDVPAVLGHFDPDIEWIEADGFPYPGTFVGPDAILQNVFMRLGTEWEGYTVTPKEFIAEGDRVVSFGTYAGTYKATGKSFSAPFAHAFRLRDGKVVHFHQYTDTVLVQEALKA